MILVSACLLGINCQYNGENDLTEKLLEFLKDKGTFIAMCPEVWGGLPIPRDASQIVGGTGIDVVGGKAKVMSIKNKDVTNEFITGAERILQIAKENNVELAILKAKSPSCGVGKIYDDLASRHLIDGDGVAAALLRKNGIKVMTEKDLIAGNWPK
ncbi:MAG: hypothetical protein A2365_02865 [Candidatus Nealsonbacteria bacterium RIFOXYB1_FULL_40_15]|uniref:Uncharacterized protein n=2 Tax=Candidatus Nealsoniibacteriota TaxID=1817911 RepID=A0A1G2ESV1_9BACT|nr:MAG: hypothetical protein A2365_02865 [Candidatus Nealsonbacteria bacterium RIFOXYB1_FULL_40_15]OGZ28441.1 MAG: hypothetical protein A2427_02490 [Candidatus Nealsonbacteria bacterium RIFOXYC1_FULL_40_7]OGZ29852.1 MAG: hypothetical protein A2562_01900 [Candidatus Nealsonbacteria bacterium RIFOXYD1_FULL_39_11]